MAAAAAELGAVGQKSAEDVYRAAVELGKLSIALGGAGITKDALDFAVMIGIARGELKDTGLALEKFMQDGVISLAEAVEGKLNPAQAAALEYTRERATAEQAAAFKTVKTLRLVVRETYEGCPGLSLPAAMLITTVWRQKVWHLPVPGWGHELQLLVLAGMTVVVHLSFGRYLDLRQTGRRLPTVSALLTMAGLTLVAAAAMFTGRTARELLHASGVAVWLAGAIALLASYRSPSPRSD
jgi:hypothetical protein